MPWTRDSSRTRANSRRSSRDPVEGLTREIRDPVERLRFLRNSTKTIRQLEDQIPKVPPLARPLVYKYLGWRGLTMLKGDKAAGVRRGARGKIAAPCSSGSFCPAPGSCSARPTGPSVSPPAWAGRRPRSRPACTPSPRRLLSRAHAAADRGTRGAHPAAELDLAGGEGQGLRAVQQRPAHRHQPAGRGRSAATP